jgi:hypothetical protein
MKNIWLFEDLEQPSIKTFAAIDFVAYQNKPIALAFSANTRFSNP